jgi:NADH-quinone oxidoreductase subunit M
MPGLSSFVSEVLVLIGTFQTHPLAAVIATLAIILASLYILLTYQKMFTGPEQDYAAGWVDLTRREVWVVAPLIAVIVALGFYPKPVLDMINPAVARTMNYLHVTDPQPVTPAATAAEGTNP